VTRIVHLARHGTHDEVGRALSGRSDIGLNAAGMAEAEALSAWLTERPVGSIHASPRARAQQTALPLSRRTGLKVATTPALDEIDFGTFTGLSFAALDGDPAWHVWNAERQTARCPGGETMGEAVERAVTFLHGLADDAGPALCVTHCDIIRGVVARILGLEFGRMFAIDCDPGSVSTLAIAGGDMRVVALNQRPR
jgi:ribonuclease H / adenosylcobalamin/alpha-ribazole phosphatase